MMHKLLSGKNILMIVDALYPGEDALGVPQKWQSAPFNNDWCSSLFVSLDPVAIESVCHDFLRTEYHGTTIAESRPNWDGVDDYLHQAADSSWWPDGVIYDPDNDGVIITSLGVHEHWNDSINKEYSRNLGAGEGIELMKAFEETVGIPSIDVSLKVSVYPNPAQEFVYIQSQENKTISFQLLSADGQLISEGQLLSHENIKIDIQDLAAGVYFLHTIHGNNKNVLKILKQ